MISCISPTQLYCNNLVSRHSGSIDMHSTLEKEYVRCSLLFDECDSNICTLRNVLLEFSNAGNSSVRPSNNDDMFHGYKKAAFRQSVRDGGYCGCGGGGARMARIKKLRIVRPNVLSNITNFYALL